MTPAMGVYARALRRAERGVSATLRLTRPDGATIKHLDPAAWCAEPSPADASVVTRCDGPTLDIGCGPGRLTAALARRGLAALGIDICPVAIRLAASRGAHALQRSVYHALPGEGSWRHALLIDGNLGIGGDPQRLLRRCGQLLHKGGSIVVELEPPGTPTWHGDVAISDGVRTSQLFAWSVVSVDRAAELALDANLRVAERWSQEGRWFARLSC